MEFLLHNSVFDYITLYLLLINSITIIVLSLKKQEFSISEGEHSKEKMQLNTINIYKNVVLVFWVIVLSMVIVKVLLSTNTVSRLLILYYLSFAYGFIVVGKRNISNMSYESKMIYLRGTFLYNVFFSAKAADIYIHTFANIGHIYKEYLLLSFLIIKLAFLILCLIINVSIFMVNLKSIFCKYMPTIKTKIEKYICKEYSLGFYEFALSKKYEKKWLFLLDCIIFAISSPFYILFDILMYAVIRFGKSVLKKGLVIEAALAHYFDNSAAIISKTIRISMIISLLVVYFTIIYGPGIISKRTADVYVLLITVVLIPLIYDSIKEK